MNKFMKQPNINHGLPSFTGNEYYTMKVSGQNLVNENSCYKTFEQKIL